MTDLTRRPPRLEDWSRVHGWASNEEACRFQVWGPNSPDETKAFVAGAIDSWDVPSDERERFVWLAEHATDGVIGAGELLLRSRRHRQGEIAYVVHPDYWGRGCGTRIAQLLLGQGFGSRGLHRIFATCDPRNVASIAVLEKTGMRVEGRMRQTLLLRDGWRDSALYSILESEWSGVR